MKLYLVHHGEAVPKEQDPDRPLTDKGREDLQKLATFLERAGVRVARIIHSGKERARDSAEILRARIAPGVDLEQRKGIKPDHPVEPLLLDIHTWRLDTLVAGHGPYISKLVPSLITGNQDPKFVATKPGTIICLEREERVQFCICWMLRPELLRN